MRFLSVLSSTIVLAILLSISVTHAQDVQGDVYVEASVDNPNPYVGQQIIYTFKLYDAVGLTNPLYQPSNFEGFWRIDIGAVSQTSEQINGRRYNVTTIATALYPTHSGSIAVQPASVVLPETVFHSKQTLTANSVSLDVKLLPVSNSTVFSGAVGQFTMSASLDRQTVNIGDPVTMTLTLSGTGNVEQQPAPVVPDKWRATINAGKFGSEVQNGLIVGSRDYQIVFFPTTSGAQELPPITLEYFDPVGANYKTVSTSPIQIQVTGDAISSPNTSSDFSEPSLRLKPIGNLTPNDATPLLTLIAVLLPLCGVGVIGYQQRLKTRKAQLKSKLRRQQALQVAMRGIKTVPMNDSKSGYQLIDIMFDVYIADKLDIDLEPIKQSDLLEFLTRNKVSESVQSKVQSFILEIEEGLFSPAIDVISPQKRDDMINLLREIDAEWVTE
jgi:hypothetical protein